MLLHEFVKVAVDVDLLHVVTCISHPLPNKTELMFDQDLKIVEASVLNKRY